MARVLSTKRLAVAQRYSKRLQALMEKGYDIEPLKTEIKKISGVTITKKGKVNISESVYKKEGESIRKGLEGIVKTTKEHAKLVKKREKAKKYAKKYGEAAEKRVEKLADTFEMSKEEFLERVNDVEGVLVTKDGNIIIDPELFNADTRAALKAKIGSEKEMLEDAKKALLEEGLSEGDIEDLGRKGIIKKAREIQVFESDTSVFKKFYEVFDKENKGSVLPQYGSSSRLNASSFDELYDSMVELGHIVHDTGYKNDYWSQKKDVEKLIDKVKNL